MAALSRLSNLLKGFWAVNRPRDPERRDAEALLEHELRGAPRTARAEETRRRAPIRVAENPEPPPRSTDATEEPDPPRSPPEVDEEGYVKRTL